VKSIIWKEEDACNPSIIRLGVIGSKIHKGRSVNILAQHPAA
jgi:hypothetical protein